MRVLNANTKQWVSGQLAKGSVAVNNMKAGMSGRGGLAGTVRSLASFGGLFNPWVVGLAAAGTAAFVLYKHIKKSADEVRQMNNMEGLGKIFGFEVSENAQAVAGGVGEATRKVKALSDEYPELIRRMNTANSTYEKFRIASSMGMKAFDAGATVDQARDVVVTALDAAQGISNEEANKIVMKFKFDPTDLEQRARDAILSLQNATTNSDNSNVLGRLKFWEDKGKSDAEAAGKSIAKTINMAIENGDVEGAVKFRDRMFAELTKQFAASDDPGGLGMKFLESYGENLNIPDAEIKKAKDNWNDALRDIEDSTNIGSKEWNRKLAQLTSDIASSFDPNEAFKGFDEGQEKADKFSDVLTKLYNAEPNERSIFGGGLDITNGQFTEILEKMRAGEELTGAQAAKLAVLEDITGLRIAGEDGILAVLEAQLGKYGEIESVQNAVSSVVTTLSKAYQRANKQELEDLEDAQEARVDGMRAAADAQQEGHRKEQERLDDAHEREQNRFKDAQDRQQKALKRRQEAEEKRLKDSYDKRLDALKQEEEVRKRNFEAEKSRIEQLRDMMNRNIDYNAALNSGDFDKAAQIQNDAQAQTELDALDALDQKMGDAASKRIDALEAKRDRASERLKKRQQAEKESLDRVQTREERLFKRRQELESRRLQTAQRNAQKIAQANIDAAQKGFEAERKALEKTQAKRKQTFDAAMQEIKSFNGRSGKELSDHLARVQAKYGNFGTNVKIMGKGWARAISDELVEQTDDAIRKLRENSKFEKSGRVNAKNWLKGSSSVTGLSFGELKKYSEKHWSTGYQGGQVRHEGGPIGSGKGRDSRRGYGASAAPFSSEEMVLAERGEYMVDKKTHKALGTGFLDNLKKIAKDPHGGNGMDGFGGSSDGRPMGIPLSASVPFATTLMETEGTLLNRMLERTVANADAAAAVQGMKGGVSTGTKGSLPRTGFTNAGWRKPWQGHFTTRNGHDWNLPSGTPIKAPHDGFARGYDNRGYEPRIPVQNGYKSYGRVIQFAGGGRTIMFAHNSQRNVGDLTPVKKGEILGYSGATGHAFGAHSHVEVNGEYGGLARLYGQLGIPLKVGGTVKYDDVPAILHKKEKVLTAPLSESLERGIHKLDQNGGMPYTVDNRVTVVVEGNVDSDDRIDQIARRVEQIQKTKEGRYGKKR